MTLPEAEEAADIPFVVEEFDTFEGYCYFAHSEGPENDMYFLVVSPGSEPVTDPAEGVIGRVTSSLDFTASPASTVSGISLGSTESEVYETYPGQIESTPHEYVEGGHCLTFTPRDPVDQPYRLRFFTDGEVVQARSLSERRQIPFARWGRPHRTQRSKPGLWRSSRDRGPCNARLRKPS